MRYLHRSSYRRTLSKGFRFSRGQSSTPRLHWSLQRPGCVYRSRRGLRRNNQVSLNIKCETNTPVIVIIITTITIFIVIITLSTILLALLKEMVAMRLYMVWSATYLFHIWPPYSPGDTYRDCRENSKCPRFDKQTADWRPNEKNKTKWKTKNIFIALGDRVDVRTNLINVPKTLINSEQVFSYIIARNIASVDLSKRHQINFTSVIRAWLL